MVAGFRNKPYQRFDESILMGEMFSGKINTTELIRNWGIKGHSCLK